MTIPRHARTPGESRIEVSCDSQTIRLIRDFHDDFKRRHRYSQLEIAFIKSNLGSVLLKENNAGGGTVDTYVYSSQHERDLLRRMGEIAYTHYSFDRATAWIRGHKKAYLEGSVKRALAFWVANHVTGMKRWVWGLYQIPLLVSAAVGLWRHWGRSPVTTLCFAILLVVPSAYYLTGIFDSHRLRLPFEVLLTIFSSAALTAAQVEYDQAKQRP